MKGMEVLGHLADDETLRGLNKAQVGLLLSFLRDSCVREEGPDVGMMCYVTYDTGPCAIRPAFHEWLEEQGHSLIYVLPHQVAVIPTVPEAHKSAART